MHSLAERLSRLRWMALPVAAYVAITLLLPAANGVAVTGPFLRHAGWVLAGCVAMVGVVLVGGLAAEGVMAATRRLANSRGGRRVRHQGGRP